MNQRVKVGIIADYSPQKYFSHALTNEALAHAAVALSVPVDVMWIPTPPLSGRSTGRSPGRSIDAALKPFDALWCGPGSPYESMDGALEAVRFARETGRPFLAT